MKERIKQSAVYKKLKRLFDKYERYLIPGMLLAGVAVDFFTFKNIELKTAFTLLVIYIFAAGAAVAFLNFYDEYKQEYRSAALRYLRLVAPLVIQFTFGALLSASFIFYWFSGAFSVSWPFIVIVALLMVSNEALRHYYQKPVVQINVYYFILFSVSALILPFVFNSIAPWVFMLSGALSLLVIVFYGALLMRMLDYVRWERDQIVAGIMTVFVAMNLLYFLNIIPPIPLSLREAGVYRDVQRTVSGYDIQTEEETFLERAVPGQTVHVEPGGRVYVFTAIFAPAELNTQIVHEWNRFDETERKWVSVNRLPFSITGGREAGYRGYSLKTHPAEGRWRVDVETQRGQVLGRVRFRVRHVIETPELIQIKK